LSSGEPELVTQLYTEHKELVVDLRSSPEVRLLLALAKASGEIKTTAASRPLL
jgi:hypothetical protein